MAFSGAEAGGWQDSRPGRIDFLFVAKDMAEGNEYEARETHARVHKEISLLKALCGIWNRLSRGALESPSLQVFKKQADVELRSMTSVLG